MVQSLNHALIHGHLNITQRQGIISRTQGTKKIGFTWKTGDQYPFLTSITKLKKIEYIQSSSETNT